MIEKDGVFCADYRADSGILRITLGGEIDHHSAVRVRSDIDALLYRLRPKKLELVLSDIGFMDSSGLGLAGMERRIHIEERHDEGNKAG